ncbi:hypothetical protein THII_3751 [Thioploca ingrica]|uniref:Uncharacterized protein n=1 Tax=Thioploca ingrica TaxID=40754 RepID=A0A090AI40_9GAMM|nr:hypothetical protein THII_3751 [Thioploca ingrica]
MANNLSNEYPSIPCCPELKTDPICDIMDMRRRLKFPTHVRTETGQPVFVEVIIHTRFTRCSGPLALGDLVYSTTLLPGEKVRLATTDRRSRFSFDSSTNLSHRSEQISEEQYRMTALRSFMMDASSTDQTSQTNTENSSWDFHGDAEGSLGFFSVGAETNARGSYNASSTRDFLGEHRAHAQTADHQSVEATRKAHSMSIGEVSTRQHKEGESQEHFESSSREFTNPNKCHAVTFLFYRINKMEIIKFTLESIERRVLDPSAVTRPIPVPISTVNKVSAITQFLPATTVVMAKSNQPVTAQFFLQPTVKSTVTPAVPEITSNTPLSEELRKKALTEVDEQLFLQGLLDKEGQVSAPAQREFSFDRQTSLPTAGVIVKGCLDDCDICETTRQKEIELELERKALENKLLTRQIDLLEQSSEYRCCPKGEEKQPA